MITVARRVSDEALILPIAVLWFLVFMSGLLVVAV